MDSKVIIPCCERSRNCHRDDRGYNQMKNKKMLKKISSDIDNEFVAKAVH